MRDQLNKGEHLSTPLKQKKNSFFQGGETKRMKTRKIMASLLAFAMLLSLVAVPVGSVDAASNNSVDRVLQVADDHKFTAADAVKLRIEEKYAGEFKGVTDAVYGQVETFDLILKNAKFGGTVGSVVVGNLNTDGFRVEKVSNTKATVTLKQLPANTTPSVWSIPLVSEVTASGEITATIDARDSFLSSGTFTYAIAADGGSVATVGSVKKFSDPTQVLDTLTIDETRIGSLDGAQKDITFRLPNNFSWVNDNNVQIVGKSGLTTNSKGSGSADYKITTDGRELKISGLDITSSNTARGKLVITGLEVKAASSAKFGEVSLRIHGGKLSTQDLLVAEYREYGVIVEAGKDLKELPELYAGRWAYSDKFVSGTALTGEEEHELQSLKIEENSAGAWLTSRRTRIEFPTGVKIIGVEVVKEENVDTTTKSATDIFSNVSDLGKNYIEFSAIEKDDITKKTSVELKFNVSVAANFAGDITAKVSGTALLNEETEVVLGKAVAPVTVEAGSVDLRIGVLEQGIGEIVITETEAGAILAGTGKTIKVSLGDSKYFVWSQKPTVEVIEGDIELKTKSTDINKKENYIEIEVKSDSSKPSKIKISGATVNLDRTVPEGVFEVKVGGSALVENSSQVTTEQDKGLHGTSNAASFKALNVITPAPGEERRTVKFNLDSKEYVVIEAGKEVTKTMDVAPYNENGRALLPIRFVAEALGVSEDNIVWNANTKEVTIFKGDRVAKVAIGSNKLVVNGTEVVMDTTAAIKDGRTVLPIRFVGQALGANIGWDDATRTITVQQ